MIGQLTTKQPFDLERTLKCGQGHRWRMENVWYTSILKVDDPNSGDIDKLVWIRQQDGKPVEYKYESKAEQSGIEAVLRWQFRLQDNDEDVRVVYAHLGCDPQVKALVQHYSGLRVMRVDPWECLAFFMLASGGSINSGKAITDNIAEKFSQCSTSDSIQLYPFPSLDTVASQLGSNKLKGLYPKKGPLLNRAARFIREKRSRLNCLASLEESENVISELMELDGVQDKIANCVALFSLGKLDAFPVDVRIERALNCRYGRTFGIPKDRGAMRKWSQCRFGSYAGYASQFLFIWDLEDRPSV